MHNGFLCIMENRMLRLVLNEDFKTVIEFGTSKISCTVAEKNSVWGWRF